MVSHYSLYSMPLDKTIILSNMLGLLVFVAIGAVLAFSHNTVPFRWLLVGLAGARGLSKQPVRLSYASVDWASLFEST